VHPKNQKRLANQNGPGSAGLLRDGQRNGLQLFQATTAKGMKPRLPRKLKKALKNKGHDFRPPMFGSQPRQNEFRKAVYTIQSVFDKLLKKCKSA
jgi:hypothetical protein